MLLSSIIPEGGRLVGRDAEISRLCADSRGVEQGDVFFCVPGLKFDGHAFAADAVRAGAAALVTERALDIGAPCVVVDDVRRAMALMAAAFYGHPERRMRFIGVTGTNGKTSTTHLIKAAADACGYKAGLIGTVKTLIGTETIPANLTTPDPIELYGILARMAQAGIEWVIMEVSAHALFFRKMEGMLFDVAVFTNLSQDHLDFFHTMERYEEAKRMFFRNAMSRVSLFNADDDTTGRMKEGVRFVKTFGVREPADFHANDIEITHYGVSYALRWQGGEMRLRLRLPGMFNIYNSLAAATACLLAGMDAEGIRAGLEGVKNLPGRIEQLDMGTPYRIILDYAHSPDSLRNILKTVRENCDGRVIVVFGCGGDREQEKRPIMGAIAARMADFTVLTSDNPRSEEPMDIIRMIEDGLKPISDAYTVIESRREAIKHAMSMAEPGDIVLLAGKGHETYQEIKGVKRPFDEKIIVREIIEEESMPVV